MRTPGLQSLGISQEKRGAENLPFFTNKPGRPGRARPATEKACRGPSRGDSWTEGGPGAMGGLSRDG